MAIQVSYPGVYIDEFAPAAPIEGVSTSIAAFIGLAARGPVAAPTLVTSIDAFTATFGGPRGGAVPYWLPLAVDGFFRNGGTTAFVVRVSDAVAASIDLMSREGVARPLAALTARVDGAAGDGGSVTVADASTLGAALTAAGAGTTAPVHRATQAVTALDATRRQASVADSSGFQAGDRVVLSQGADTAIVTVAGVEPGLVRFASAAPSRTAATEWDQLTTDDLKPGDTVVRLDLPAGMSLRAALSAGAALSLADGTTTAWATVASVGADSVTLDAPLTATLDLTGPTGLASAEFDLTITDPSGTARSYRGLSTGPLHPRWWSLATADDEYAQLAVDSTVFPTGDPRPATGTTSLAAATPEDAAASWALVASNLATYLRLLEPIDEISLVAVPGLTDTGAQAEVVNHCERMFDRFAVLDSQPGIDLPTVRAQRTMLTGSLDKGFAALYYPWILIRDPVRNQVVSQPPSGHVVGIYAQTDQRRGVHKAPANVAIAGAIGLERRLTDTEQGLINLDGVNALRILPGRGTPVVWGARTTANDRNWQYINIRRLFLFVEESIQESLVGYVFEPNDLALWQKLKRTITEFLTRVWRDGALFGETAKDAFYVRIDEALNPPSTRKLGRLYLEIGLQPVYPAEFIVVRIGIWDGGSDVAES